MKRGKLLAGVVTATAGLALASIVPGTVATASPRSRAASNPAVVGGRVKVNAAAILRYWTPERRAAAKNVDIITAKSATTSALREVSTGTPRKVAGGLP